MSVTEVSAIIFINSQTEGNTYIQIHPCYFNSGMGHWLRTRYGGNNSDVWLMKSDGCITNFTFSTSQVILRPIIRLGQ